MKTIIGFNVLLFLLATSVSASHLSLPIIIPKHNMPGYIKGNSLCTDTSGVDAYLHGKYKVVKVRKGTMTDSVNIIHSEEVPVNMTSFITSHAVKFVSNVELIYDNLGDKMVNDDEGSHAIHFLCVDLTPDLKMIVFRDYINESGLLIGVINMNEMTFTDYELVSLK